MSRVIYFGNAKKLVRTVKFLEEKGVSTYGKGVRSGELPFSQKRVYDLEREGILEITGTLKENRIVSLEGKGYYQKRDLERFDAPKTLVDLDSAEKLEINKILDVQNGHRYLGTEKVGHVVIPNATYHLYRLAKSSWQVERELKEEIANFQREMGWL